MVMNTAQIFKALARFLPASLNFSEKLAYLTAWGVQTFESTSWLTSTAAGSNSLIVAIRQAWPLQMLAPVPRLPSSSGVPFTAALKVRFINQRFTKKGCSSATVTPQTTFAWSIVSRRLNPMKRRNFPS